MHYKDVLSSRMFQEKTNQPASDLFKEKQKSENYETSGE